MTFYINDEYSGYEVEVHNNGDVSIRVTPDNFAFLIGREAAFELAAIIIGGQEEVGHDP